jgi:hypothetical protein
MKAQGGSPRRRATAVAVLGTGGGKTDPVASPPSDQVAERGVEFDGKPLAVPHDPQSAVDVVRQRLVVGRGPLAVTRRVKGNFFVDDAERLFLGADADETGDMSVDRRHAREVADHPVERVGIGERNPRRAVFHDADGVVAGLAFPRQAEHEREAFVVTHG